MLRNLRDLGMGRTHLENSIHDEAKMLVEYLEKNSIDKPTEMDWGINIAVLNVIWQMLASELSTCLNNYNIDNYGNIHDKPTEVD